MTWRLRVVDREADRRAYVDLVNTLQPEWLPGTASRGTTASGTAP